MEKQLFARCKARAEFEILDDISRGYVPLSVKAFDEIHAFMDANCYGGVADSAGVFSRSAFPTTEDWLAFVGELHAHLDGWIKSGSMAHDFGQFYGEVLTWGKPSVIES